MKSANNTVILLFLFFGMQQFQAQTYKFQTTGFTVLEKNNKGSWSKWSDFQKTSVLITLDTQKNRILIYSQEIQLFEILNYEKKQEDDTNETYAFTCRDDDGEPFIISVITRKKQGNRKQMYINHKNAIVVYNISNYIENDDKSMK